MIEIKLQELYQVYLRREYFALVYHNIVITHMQMQRLIADEKQVEDENLVKREVRRMMQMVLSSAYTACIKWCYFCFHSYSTTNA